MVKPFTKEGNEHIKKLKQYYKKHPEEAKAMRKRWWDNESKSFSEFIQKQLKEQKNSK